MTSYERGWRDAVKIVLDRVETLSSLAETPDEKKFSRTLRRALEPLNNTPPAVDLDFETLRDDVEMLRGIIASDPQAALAAGLTPVIEQLFRGVGRAGGGGK